MAIAIKAQEQIEGIRKSCQLASRCLDIIHHFVVPGITTGELNDRIAEFILENGATSATLGYHGYPKETCISVNEVICHGIPGSRVLAKGDIVNIDVTTILDGYYGDTSRMYGVGIVSTEASDLMWKTLKCLEAGIEQVRPGNPFGLIGRAITKLAESCGYSVVDQFVGHGVGLQFHEPPQICHYIKNFEYDRGDSIKMKPGMIFTIEPMINAGVRHAIINEADGWTASTADGKLSAQWEHTLLVTEDGVEILTQSKHE